MLVASEGTMDLTRELTDQIRSYVEQRCTLAELRAWLAGLVPVLDASEDLSARQLADRLWTILAELDYGHRDEPGARAGLAELLNPSDIVQHR
jgi:hypothetical protein